MPEIKQIARQRDYVEQIHGEIIKGIDDDIEELFAQLDKDIIAEAKNNIQNNSSIDRGDLLASVKVLHVDKITHTHTIGSDAEHAAYVELGRGPIKAKPGKTLHFVAKDTGEDVFVKSVGPAEAMPFLAPAMITVTDKFTDIIVAKQQEKINRIINSL